MEIRLSARNSPLCAYADPQALSSIEITGDLGNGWINQAQSLDERNVKVVKTGTEDDLKQFEELVSTIRHLIFDQEDRERHSRR